MPYSKSTSRLFPLFLLIQCILFFSPAVSYALQTHAALEGLYAHQGAHIFFMLSMIIFALRIYKSELTQKKSWRFLFWGVWLLGLWNLWAFTGHILAISIANDQTIAMESLKSPQLVIATWRDVMYYILKMDHLLCVPAMLFLYLGLRKMLADTTLENTTGNDHS
jgi:hypothetical protein